MKTGAPISRTTPGVARTLVVCAALAAPAHAQLSPFEDTGFTTRSPDNDPDLVLVRERYDPATNRQSIYVRSYDGSRDHTVYSGEIFVFGATIAEVVHDGEALAATDEMWRVLPAEAYGPAEGRGLEGDVLVHAPEGRDSEDAIRRVCSRGVRFWLGNTNDVDDFRIIIQYPEQPTSASFSVTLFGGRRADPDGFPPSSQAGLQVGALVDSVPDDGDYSEVYDISRVKLRVEDLDIVERRLILVGQDEPRANRGAMEGGGPVGPETFTMDNFANGIDVDQDNGFDQNGVQSPIPVGTNLENLQFLVLDLEGRETGEVIPANVVDVQDVPASLPRGEQAVASVSAVVPAGTSADVYVGQVIVWEDNVEDGLRSGSETADSVQIVVVVGEPDDGGVDLGIADFGLPDAQVPVDSGVDSEVTDAAEQSDGTDGGADGATDGGSDDGGSDDGGSDDAGSDGGDLDGNGSDGNDPDAGPDGAGSDRAESDAPDSVGGDARAADDAAGPSDDATTDVNRLGEPLDLEPTFFDPGDVRGGAFSCRSSDTGAHWLLSLLLLGALRRSRR